MSKETERVFQELEKAMKEHEFENEEQLNAFINTFMNEYNNNVAQKRKPDAYDYLELAESAETEEEVIAYAKKALKQNRYCLDAEMLIAQAKSESIDEYKKNLEKVIQKGEKQLAERGVDMEEDAGSFYGIFETRPYMRVRKTYLELLIEQGRFCSAISEAEELLRLCENDNLGVRYSLLALYSYFEEESKALELMKKYKEDSTFMLLPMIALYYKKDDSKKVRSYITKLKNSNPDIQDGLAMILSGDSEAIAEITSADMYRPFSVEEAVLAINGAVYLYTSMPYFLDWLYDKIDMMLNQ